MVSRGSECIALYSTTTMNVMVFISRLRSLLRKEAFDEIAFWSFSGFSVIDLNLEVNG